MSGDSSIGALSPTLWRTCRVLANRTRLKLLEEIFGAARPPSVSQLAASLEMPLPTATIYLRQLDARGLISASRSGRWVRYRIDADKTIPGNDSLIEALSVTFRSNRDPIEAVYNLATAFTHPRRIRIVNELSNGATLSLTELKSRTGYSIDALARHLKKLECRCLAEKNDHRWRLTVIRGKLAKTLISIACSDGAG